MGCSPSSIKDARNNAVVNSHEAATKDPKTQQTPNAEDKAQTPAPVDTAVKSTAAPPVTKPAVIPNGNPPDPLYDEFPSITHGQETGVLQRRHPPPPQAAPSPEPIRAPVKPVTAPAPPAKDNTRARKDSGMVSPTFKIINKIHPPGEKPADKPVTMAAPTEEEASPEKKEQDAFFRMLDEKIAEGDGDDESELAD
eukprot:Colp12_sorted_trinity150504_noHs@16872